MQRLGGVEDGFEVLARVTCGTRGFVRSAGHDSPETKPSTNAAWDVLDEFMETVPTTLPGLLTMVVYAAELLERDEFDDCGDLLQSLATAAKTLIRAEAGKAVRS
jgi:hypothetical protein